MFADGADIDREELGHQFLRQPDGFAFVTCLNTLFARLSGKDQELGGAVAYQFLVAMVHDSLLGVVSTPFGKYEE
jgi:hypothetical protein